MVKHSVATRVCISLQIYRKWLLQNKFDTMRTTNLHPPRFASNHVACPVLKRHHASLPALSCIYLPQCTVYIPVHQCITTLPSPILQADNIMKEPGLCVFKCTYTPIYKWEKFPAITPQSYDTAPSCHSHCQ